jgi:hypothetical protein
VHPEYKKSPTTLVVARDVAAGLAPERAASSTSARIWRNYLTPGGPLPKSFYRFALVASIAMTAPIALYARLVGNPGLPAMALACLGTGVIVLALFCWRRNPGYGIVLTGITLNATVILANGGRMPVVDFHSDNYGTLWQEATADTRFVFLADQPFLGYGSVGDITIGLGLAVVVLAALFRRYRSSRSSLPANLPA